MALATGTVEIDVWTKLERLCCGGCGLNYAVDQDWLNERRKDGVGFRCPNGCSRVYRETEADRLKKRLEQSQRWEREASNALTVERARLNAEQRSHAATKGKVTKLRKRVANGVCPVCTRTFQALARHMHSQHPDFPDPSA